MHDFRLVNSFNGSVSTLTTDNLDVLVVVVYRYCVSEKVEKTDMMSTIQFELHSL